MSQKFEEVVVQGVAGVSPVLALVRVRGGTAYLCSVDRCKTSNPSDIEDWLVGFPISDVRMAASGEPLGAN